MNASRIPYLVLCELADTGLPAVESFSPFCLKVHRALKVCGLPYERLHGARPDAFARENPAGQVPVLLIDGEPVADSTRIVTRLDALSGDVLTRGLDARGRAEAILVEEFADSVLNGFVVAARWLDDDNWPRTKLAYFAAMPRLVRAIVPDRIRKRVRASLWARDVTRAGLPQCFERFEEMLDSLEQRAPEHGYWLGPNLSRADVAIFGQLHSLRTPLTPHQGARVDARPRLSAWLNRVDTASRKPAALQALVSPAADGRSGWEKPDGRAGTMDGSSRQAVC